MEPYQERVVAEHEDLEDKRGKLATFIKGEIYARLPREEQAVLCRQYAAMGAYSEALRDRLALWMSK